MPARASQRLLISCLASDEQGRVRALGMLCDRLGPLAGLSRAMPFDRSTYYQDEMGAGLSRRLACFQRLVDPKTLSGIKAFCCEVESSLSLAGKRTVNLDPGLLSPGSLVLASHKYAPHRICLAEGVFAELTLFYTRGEYRSMPWTYQDYAGDELRRLLGRYRSRYLWQLGREPREDSFA